MFLWIDWLLKWPQAVYCQCMLNKMNSYKPVGCFILEHMSVNQLLPATEPTQQRRDILWKGIMEDLFADFLRFFFIDADEHFDIDRGFEFLEKELHEISPGESVTHPRYVDKLVKAWYKDGTEKWLLIHVEIQGYPDTLFAARMYTYFYRICDKFQREVTTLAIYTDNDEHYHPDRYVYECHGTSFVFRFNTYKVKGQDIELLEQCNNPFATVILAVLTSLQQKEYSQGRLFELYVVLVRKLFQKSYSKEKIDKLVQFIKRHANFGDSELIHKFEEEIEVFNQKLEHMGIYEEILQYETGIAEARGELNSKKKVVKNLLSGTDFSIQTIAELADVSIDFVIEIKNTLQG
ncbi:hypothetical protein FLA_3231 [Filimonas lacunae]|nr:hypothetical protein FLA_3231 [Filimonas lacunae]